jgi:hypothetical protein
MARLFQMICLISLLGMIHSWEYPFVFSRHAPMTYVRTSIEEDGSPSSLINELNTIMTSMHNRFERMFGWPSMYWKVEDENDESINDDIRTNAVDDAINSNNVPDTPMNIELDIQKKLDTIEPVCTTVIDSPTTISPRKSRRKQLSGTQIKTCVRELIFNGQKHTSEDITTTDEKGVVIKHSKIYTSMTMDNNEYTTVINHYH